ncbi:hypothetical protein [Gracilibacillus orientalis]|uniref:hypothetical protein n=1 Tax=Gracilibacillus orientalis TaxID=334253 RepID=UPI00158783DC|nr:hypothetical protein [Gracilibacillus orientalis]
MIDWQKNQNIDTLGMKEFVKHFEKGTYPGLGTVKNLSIMHHVELVSKFLEEKTQ